MATARWHDDKAKRIAREAMAQALGVCGSDLQGKSSQEAPIDIGDLRANCSVSPVQREGDTIYVRVGYSLPYSRIQHESLHFRHPKGGKPKFLEDPFKANASRYERFISNAVKQALAKE